MLTEFETGYDIVFTILLPDGSLLTAAFKKMRCAVKTTFRLKKAVGSGSPVLQAAKQSGAATPEAQRLIADSGC